MRKCAADEGCDQFAIVTTAKLLSHCTISKILQVLCSLFYNVSNIIEIPRIEKEDKILCVSKSRF